MKENDIAKCIVQAAKNVHQKSGPGMLESVYETFLNYELTTRFNLHTKVQHGFPARYEEIQVRLGFRADIVVEDLVLIEIKSVETLAPVHFKQTLTYLRMSGLKLGILINFNQYDLNNAIRRVVNGLSDELI